MLRAACFYAGAILADACHTPLRQRYAPFTPTPLLRDAAGRHASLFMMPRYFASVSKRYAVIRFCAALCHFASAEHSMPRLLMRVRRLIMLIFAERQLRALTPF